MVRLSVLLLLACTASRPGRAGTIQGIVLDAATGRALARTALHLALVPVPGAGPESFHATAKSARSGQFSFGAVSPGLYLLTSSRAAYFPSAYAQRLPQGKGQPITVTETSQIFAELRMHRKGAISGRVLDENGIGAGCIGSRIPGKKTAPLGWFRHN